MPLRKQVSLIRWKATRKLTFKLTIRYAVVRSHCFSVEGTFHSRCYLLSYNNLWPFLYLRQIRTLKKRNANEMGVIEGKRFQTEFFSDLFGFLVSISEFLHYWLRLNFFNTSRKCVLSGLLKGTSVFLT